MKKKRLWWESAYDKAVRGLPMSRKDVEQLDMALYWTVHQGPPPWPAGPKQELIRRLKKEMYGQL